MIKKIGILTSGGDAPGMNAAIRAVARAAIKHGIEAYGIFNGYKGLVEGDIKRLTKGDVSDILSRGGTILGSARLKEFKNEEVQELAIKNLKKHGIDALVVIGGDGSYRGALALTKKGINCVGLPGTIDNDIAGTDFTIGFDTALNTVVECIDKLRDTSSSHRRCSVVEVMGNRCGDLAIYSGISCGAEIIVTPESGFDEVEVLHRIKEFHESNVKSHCIVIISEKITDVHDFANKVTNYAGYVGRATILGHIQRGGSPTPFDRVLASKMAVKAVETLINGDGGKCICIKDNQLVAVDIDEALNTPRVSRRPLLNIFNTLV